MILSSETEGADKREHWLSSSVNAYSDPIMRLFTFSVCALGDVAAACSVLGILLMCIIEPV